MALMTPTPHNGSRLPPDDDARAASGNRRAGKRPSVPVILGILAVALVGGFFVAKLIFPTIPAEAVAAARQAEENAPPKDLISLTDKTDAITKLDPAFLQALLSANRAAQGDGLSIQLMSGWRSADDQRRRFERAVKQFGSKQKAELWVGSPETSPFVRGRAVEVADIDVFEWLSQYGYRWNICRPAVSEGWQFELRETDADGRCPAIPSAPF